MPKTKAWVKAAPNPVEIPSGPANGSTTIKWDTGDGSDAQVYVRPTGEPEKLFATGPAGSQSAPWIAKGVKYEFILFAGREHQKELARVVVTVK